MPDRPGGLQFHVKRQRAELAVGGEPVGVGADLGGGDGDALEVWGGLQERGDLRRSPSSGSSEQVL